MLHMLSAIITVSRLPPYNKGCLERVWHKPLHLSCTS